MGDDRPLGGCVGAYWRGRDVRARFRDAAGNLAEGRFPARHGFFLRAADLSRPISGGGDLGAALSRGRAVRGVEVEGAWVRVEVVDRDAQRALCEPGGYFSRIGVETFEGDLHPVKRWMLDERIKVGRPLRAYVDTEAYLPRGFDLTAGKLLCASIVTDADEEVATPVLEEDSFKGERDLLLRFLAAIEPFDQILAWNGDRFDFEFLAARAEALGVDVDWRRWLRLDHMILVKRMNVSASKSGAEKRSFALAAWAAHVLGEKKAVDLSEGQHVAWRMWLAGGAERERLARYCRDDAGKMARIERGTGFVELHQSICEAAGVLPDSRTIGPKQFVETFIMRLGHERGMRFPSFFGYEPLQGEDGDEKKFAGAFVLKPTKLGIVENVHVCDYSRLYPSIAQSENLSPETLFKRASEIAPGEVPPFGVCVALGTGHWFRAEPRGLLPFVFDEMLRQRKLWDDKKAALPFGSPEWNDADKRSTAYKNMTNAAFGVTGSRWSRFFVVECAESMTLGGSVLIQRVIEEGERVGIETFMGDTDSAFCERVTRAEFEAFVARLNRDVFPAMLKAAGAPECRIKLAYEKAFDRIVVTSSKHYAGRVLHFKGTPANEDSEPEVKGLEYKRGDAAPLACAMQAEALDLLLGGGVLEGSKRRARCESDPQVFVKLVDRWRSRVLNRDLPIDEIKVSRRLSKEPGEYKRPTKKDGSLGLAPPQARVAEELLRRGRDVGAGVRVEYLTRDAKKSDVIPAEDYDGENVDRAHLWEKVVYPATERVLAACFPEIKWELWGRVRKHMGLPGQARLFEF